MSASYTVMEYLGIPLAAGLGGLAIILTVSIWLPLKLKHKFTSYLLPILLFLLPIFACIALCIWLFPVFDTVGNILVSSEYTARTTAGRIETVTDSDLGTFHFHNGALRAGEEIVIDGASYYVISEGKLTEGMHIAVEYAQFENNVILSWREVSEEEAQKIHAENPYIEFEMHDEKPQPTVSEKDMRIGSRLEQIGFVGFVAYVVLTNAFSQKIKTFFANRATAQGGEIKPYTAWLLFKLIPLAFMSLIVIGVVFLTGHSYVFLFLAIGGGGILVFTHINLFTRLRLDGNTFTICRFGREKTYRLEDIRAVYFRRGRGMIEQTMVLVLNEGKSYWFDKDSFAGVDGVYEYIREYLDKTQQHNTI